MKVQLGLGSFFCGNYAISIVVKQVKADYLCDVQDLISVLEIHPEPDSAIFTLSYLAEPGARFRRKLLLLHNCCVSINQIK